MFSEKELNLQESELRDRVRNLPDEQRKRYLELEGRQLRSLSVYKRLNALFFLGLNHFYLERWLRGVINLLATAVAIYLYLFNEMRGYPVLILLGIVFIEIPQTINARHLVHSVNNRIMEHCLARVGDRGPAQRPAGLRDGN